MNLLKSRLKLVKGTRFVSFLFIGCSILIAAGILFAANMYYNIDTGEIVMEEIQRTTGLIRAVGGAIIGGTVTQDPAAGYGFEVATSSLFSAGDVVLSAADQLLKFTGGTTGPEYYVGFRATTTISTSTTYTWPSIYGSTGQALVTTADGVLSWSTPAGMGTITKIGDVTALEAFTTSTVAGTSLWFHNSDNMGQLTIGTLTANATYTLPDLTGTIALQNAGNLGTGGVLFANSGLIATSTNFYWDDASHYLRLGSNANAGELRIYSSGGDYYLGFAANPGMAIASTTYTWPTSYGTDNFVLTTDGTGQLSWQNVTGSGAVIGTGAANQVTYWTGTSDVSGSNNFTWNGSLLNINGNITATGTIQADTSLVTPLITYAGELQIQTTGSGDIVLYPASGIVQLGTSTHIETASGYQIGAAGTQVLREMIPIFGFDLPSQTATTSYVQISRVIEDYPFSATTTGTTRVHRFAIRYADATSTASTTWRVWNVTDSATTTTFEVPPSAGTDVEKGEAYITPDITIPIDTDDWRLDLTTSGDAIRVFQIFLAAYDQIQ